MNTCDVIIPVHNRAAVLAQVLRALCEQKISQDWRLRVIICDDGSTEDIKKVLDVFFWQNPWVKPLLITSEHKGIANARNLALEQATADIIFFLGADIILQPDALDMHLRAHRAFPQENTGCLGMVKWDPRIKPTAFMEWMTHGGQQNDFDSLLGRQKADPAHSFYASHVSVKRALMGSLRFADEYTSYGWEDLDFGRRLKRKGLELIVLHDSVGLHSHVYSLKDILARQSAVGQGYEKYLTSNKLNNSPILSFWRRVKVLLCCYSGLGFLMRAFLATASKQTPFPQLFLWITSYYFWKGVYRQKDMK